MVLDGIDTCISSRISLGAADYFAKTGVRPSFSFTSHPFPTGDGRCGLGIKSDFPIAHW